jgi:hypothetical protein
MTFHKILFLVSLSFGLVSGASAQAVKPKAPRQNTTTDMQASDNDISAIRGAVQSTNSKSLKKQHYTYESAGCAEDGVVDYFFDNKEIVKIMESGAIGDGSWVDEYYSRSGKVIFCFETIIGGPAIGKVTKTEYRVYVKDGRPIKTMEGTKTVKDDTKAREYIETASKIFKAYASKDFVGALCN